MGAPPFAAFASEWLLLARAADMHYFAIAIAIVIGLAISFVAVLIHLGRVVFGEKPGRAAKSRSGWSLIPSVVLLVAAAVAGIVVTPSLLASLERALGSGGIR